MTHRLQAQAQVYSITTEGDLPVALPQMKEYLKLGTGGHPEDDLISELLESATLDVEKALGRREIRTRTYSLLQDDFEDRIVLRRDPVSAVTLVEHVVSGSFATVSSEVYYLKKGVQASEILISDGRAWPSDTDTLEHGIRITFTTASHACLEIAKAAIKRHVSFMYLNRGDCDPGDVLVESGAEGLLSRSTIKRV